MANLESTNNNEIAIIGMSGRFPGASTVDQFWHNLVQGVEGIRFFSDQELLEAGVAPQLLDHPNYVKANAPLEGIEQFDAGFFGFSPREAALLDPQHRFFLECAWEALEQAGYAGQQARSVGVYAGCEMSSYLLHNLLHANQEVQHQLGSYDVIIGNDKDFLATRVSYKLNLTGPSVGVQTACSTSLVAVHLACQSLLSYECDMALAGGASITVPQVRGYLCHEESVLSPDGHCRPFDADAQGMLAGSGVGVVLLKRLASALEDGDHIYAVIKGSAVNNDGANKVGYTAPSVEAQAAVIAEALAVSQVDPGTIGYVEAHGTATRLGDPIEVAALTRAFRADTDQPQFCALGSLKSNIGHLDAAAGVAGLIKATLALHHDLIPPTLHFTQPNPQLDLAASPFYVNSTVQPWPTSATPRRAGVSSLGIGGTNAHVILEQAPPPRLTTPSRRWHLLPLAARSQAALDALTTRLAAHLRAHPDLPLAEVTYTLQVGRQPFPVRRAIVCQDRAQALAALDGDRPEPVRARHDGPPTAEVVLLFPGQGSQYVGMGKDLYQHLPPFRAVVDDCCARLQPRLGLDLRAILFPAAPQADAAAQQLTDTRLAQPALFVIEYALAQLWLSWGIEPVALLGHSLGEYVAACLAGVFTLDDALTMVAARGRLMHQSAPGAMLSVSLSEIALRPLLPPEVALAAINGPHACVVAGPHATIEALEAQLTAQDIAARRLHTAHAFHSPAMEPVLPAFRAVLDRVQLQPPTRAVVSNVTGQWLTAAQATDPAYWVRQLREPVQFAAGLATAHGHGARVLLEVGPGQALSTLARQQVTGTPAVATLRHAQQAVDDEQRLTEALGALWLAGVPLDWTRVWGTAGRRVPLPTYPFERQRYWVAPRSEATAPRNGETLARAPLADWFYAPTWKQSRLPDDDTQPADRHWLLFVDAHGLGRALGQALTAAGEDVVWVEPDDHFAAVDRSTYRLPPGDRDGYRALLAHLAQAGRTPTDVVHLWSVGPAEPTEALDQVARAQAEGFYSLLGLAQALGGLAQSCRLTVLSSGVQSVTGVETLVPARATLLGPCRVIPQEYPHLRCRSIDLEWPLPDELPLLVAHLSADLAHPAAEPVVAYRGRHRWVPQFERLPLPAQPRTARLRAQGVYLITGGFGGLGSVLAQHLAETVQARLVLVGRTALPARSAWTEWLATHPAEEGVSRRIRHVQALEALGSEVLALAADVADQTQVQAMMTAIEARFGTLHGIIHTAGVPGGGLIQLKTQASAAAVMAPKVEGTLLLASLAPADLDFFVLYSSQSAILGELGQVDYCAANAFLDAFAAYQAARNAPYTVSINWDTWKDAGMGLQAAQRLAEQVDGRTGDRDQADFDPDLNVRMGISSQEGVAAFQRILGATIPQIVVATRDFGSIIERARHLTTATVLQELGSRNGSADRHPRPNLATPYVAPGSDVERTLAEIWQELLGIEQVGIHDNFLELGGHSLLGTQLVSRIHKQFRVSLPLETLFSAPTVAEFAEYIETRQWATQGAVAVSGSGAADIEEGEL